jgi:hypothetical protein
MTRIVASEALGLAFTVAGILMIFAIGYGF